MYNTKDLLKVLKMELGEETKSYNKTSVYRLTGWYAEAFQVSMSITRHYEKPNFYNKPRMESY